MANHDNGEPSRWRTTTASANKASDRLLGLPAHVSLELWASRPPRASSTTLLAETRHRCDGDCSAWSLKPRICTVATNSPTTSVSRIRSVWSVPELKEGATTRVRRHGLGDRLLRRVRVISPAAAIGDEVPCQLRGRGTGESAEGIGSGCRRGTFVRPIRSAAPSRPRAAPLSTDRGQERPTPCF